MPELGNPLTERELSILRLVATGVTNRQVAHRLDISTNTVKVHLRNVFTKIGAESRTEATMIAVREGWVAVDGPEKSPTGDDERTLSSAPTATLPVPLPAFKRGALIAAALCAVAGIALTWPRGDDPRQDDSILPPRPPSEQTTPPALSAVSVWHERAQMPTRRAYLALAVAGNRILAIGGQTPEGITTAVEIYDPREDLWSRGSSKPAGLLYAHAATIGTDVYVPGGCDEAGTPTHIVEVYDVVADSWREASPLPKARCAAALAAWEERLYLFGGWDGSEYSDRAYTYDPRTDRWTEIAPMGVRRGFAAAAPLQDLVFVIGGHDGERELTTCSTYDPAAGTWNECAPLTVGRGGLGLAVVGGQIYAIGGGGWTTYLGFSERYTPASDTWKPFETPLIKEWRSPGIVTHENTIYAAGGWSSDYLSLNMVYEPLPFRVFVPVSQQD
jgi:DNA-binding CsgD family transcriptional regulator/N-acetylneuraminic acid mutarotase